MVEYTISRNNLHLVDSYLVPKDDFRKELDPIRVQHQTECEVFLRSDRSLCREWATNNFYYMVGIEPERTRDCDLNYPQKWWVSAAYWVVGMLVWPFIP